MRRILPYLLALLTAITFVANLLYGSVRIPVNEVINILLGGVSEKAAWGYIILESRLPQALTA